MISKKKIVFLSGKKGGFDAMLPFLKLVKKKNDFNLKVLMTDQHLNKKFGNTYLQCKKEIGSKSVIKLKLIAKKDDSLSRSMAMSTLLNKLSKLFTKLKPNLLIVYGDRMESLVASIVSINFGIPICHFQGGDLSGNLDEKIRHAITKLSNLHLTSNKKSLYRVRKMGEGKKISFNIGDNHIDSIKKIKFKNNKIKFLKKKYLIGDNYAVFMLHPDGISAKKNEIYCKNSLSALKNLDLDIICIYPCSDIGHESIINQLKKISIKYKRFHVHKYIPHEEFIELLKNSKFFIGNSSSGIIESAYLKIPFINLGNRQKGRLCSKNILHSSFNVKEIQKKIKISQSKNFKNNHLQKADLLYGNGKSYEKAYSILKSNINSLSQHKNFYE